MVITNVKIVTLNKVIENGYVIISGERRTLSRRR